MAHPRAPQRIRHELRFRQITVSSKTRVADAFWRIVFDSDALAGFQSAGFDDHIKLFFPHDAGHTLQPTITAEGVSWPDGVRPLSRDYTPLNFDGQRTLTLDFYIHDGGVASAWADNAQPGDILNVGGPRGSLVVPEDYAFQLYVCDESGLPAMLRRQATMQAEQSYLFAFVDREVGEAYLPALNGLQVQWLGHDALQAGKVDALLGQFDALNVPDNDYFIWLTGEGTVAKALSDYFVEQRLCDPEFVRAVAYWHQK